MINTLIFDFGDVFLNLNKAAPDKAFKKLGITGFTPEMLRVNQNYETGTISTQEFLRFYLTRFPTINKTALINAWNSIILDFPQYRLDFLKKLRKANQFTYILLSNTNVLHIEKVTETMGMTMYNQFKNCFDAFYLSQEIGFRKPNQDIFEFVLNQNNLIPEECFFVDDTAAHINTAKSMGMLTWNINPHTEDVTQLLTKFPILQNE